MARVDRTDVRRFYKNELFALFAVRTVRRIWTFRNDLPRSRCSTCSPYSLFKLFGSNERPTNTFVFSSVDPDCGIKVDPYELATLQFWIHQSFKVFFRSRKIWSCKNRLFYRNKRNKVLQNKKSQMKTGLIDLEVFVRESWNVKVDTIHTVVPNDIVFSGTIILELIHSLQWLFSAIFTASPRPKWVNPPSFSYGVWWWWVCSWWLSRARSPHPRFWLWDWEETSNHKKFEFVGIESVRVERENLKRTTPNTIEHFNQSEKP